MKRLKIFKAYFVLWLFVYFIAITNLETFKLYFLSTLTFNIAITAILAIGTFMLLKAAKDLTMVAGTFGVIMYKKGDLSFYLKGIEKTFPSTIANRLKNRSISQMLYFTREESDDILAWLEEKFSNQNRYNNFFIGTVLMIGLLGTFAGLLGSISSMGSIVSSLAGNNVDIGKIMGGFSKPLSSMAVGFGSSLFGVISAVLLSIKGYILNKSQESLISGVENWLQSRLVEEKSINESSEKTLISNSSLKESSRSYMDIFVDQMGALNQTINRLTSEQRELKESFNTVLDHLSQESKNNQKGFITLASSMNDIARTNQMVQNGLKELYRLQTSSQESVENRERLLLNMINKVEKKDEELKVGIFEMVDAIENMDKNLKAKNTNIERLLRESLKSKKGDTHSKLDEIGEFMRRHLAKEEI